MKHTVYKTILVFLASSFTIVLAILCVPPLIEEPDILGAIGGGFVNPFATGYSLDAIFCWFVLAVWVVFEARNKGVRRGWVALLLGVVPGVTVGFAGYLLIRQRQVSAFEKSGDGDAQMTPSG